MTKVQCRTCHLQCEHPCPISHSSSHSRATWAQCLWSLCLRRMVFFNDGWIERTMGSLSCACHKANIADSNHLSSTLSAILSLLLRKKRSRSRLSQSKHRTLQIAVTFHQPFQQYSVCCCAKWRED